MVSVGTAALTTFEVAVLTMHPYDVSQPDKRPRPHEIVLLEDSDLYKYDHQQQYAMGDGYQLPHPNGLRANASFMPASDVGSERSAYTRPPFHAHATPNDFGASFRKPYATSTSIDTVPMSHGALRPGGAVDLFSREYIGLLLNWSLVGFFNGSLSALVSPLFETFLGYDDYQSGAASALIDFPWNFKFLMGFITDCFPIRRLRRKPYIYIGWTAFLVFMIAMTSMNERRSIDDDTDAASQGPNPAFGGSFAHAVPMRAIFGAHVLLAALGLVVTKFFLHEDLTSTSSQRLTTQFRRIWNIMQKKTTWQITLFGFFAKIGANYEIPGHGGILTKWLKADTIILNVNDAINSVGFIIAAALFMRFLLNSHWRKLYVTVVAVSLVIMIPVDMVTIFDIERNLPLYLSKVQIVSVCDAFVFILRVIVIVEVAEAGYEAVTYGILTTVFNLGSTVTSMVKNVVSSQWDPKVTSAKFDTSAVRHHFLYAFSFKYGLRIVVVCLVFALLPRQKPHLKELNLRGAPNLVIPIVLFLVFAGLFVTSLTSSMLALFESTACLAFAGGSGCPST